MIDPHAYQLPTDGNLINQIFTAANQNISNDIIENCLMLNGHDLFFSFQPQYQNANKIALFNDVLLEKQYKPSIRNLLVTRFYPRPLPSVYTSEQHHDQTAECIFVANVFDYRPTDDLSTIDWYMNFANYDIFSYYHTDLLAQDELQVLECPQLASIREYLVQTNKKSYQTTGKEVFDTNVIKNDSPFPIVISNVERVIDLNTTHLYGNNFATSQPATVLKEYRYLKPPQTVNIVAIEAPEYGTGSYTIEQIRYILQACFTCYSGAKLLANITCQLNPQNQQLLSREIPLKTHIHTGWFGCGAYGGNRSLMIVLQILAAKMAAVDKLTFHTVTNDYQSEIDVAQAYIKTLFAENSSPLSIDELITKIVNQNFQWGSSNET